MEGQVSPREEQLEEKLKQTTPYASLAYEALCSLLMTGAEKGVKEYALRALLEIPSYKTYRTSAHCLDEPLHLARPDGTLCCDITDTFERKAIGDLIEYMPVSEKHIKTMYLYIGALFLKAANERIKNKNFHRGMMPVIKEDIHRLIDTGALKGYCAAGNHAD